MILAAYKQQWLKSLSSVALDTSEVELYAILCFVFNVTSAELILRQSREVDLADLKQINEIIERRLCHEPLDYILGSSNFLGTMFHVKPGVLIPRAETELLVLTVKKWLETSIVPAWGEDIMGYECGFGSGVISISLARFFQSSRWEAFDVSEDALECARRNARQLMVTNVGWHLGDFFKNISALWSKGSPKVVVANPPYIPTADMEFLDESVRNFEPISALDGGVDGLGFYRQLFDVLEDERVWLFVECGVGQASLITAMGIDLGFTCAEVVADLQGIDRVLVFKR